MNESESLFPDAKVIRGDDPEHVLAWWDCSLDAAAWFKLRRVEPEHAAALLCGQNPDSKGFDPENTSTSDTVPGDYKKLLRLFKSSDYDGGACNVLFWLTVAREAEAKYNGWIDEYLNASNVIGHMPGVVTAVPQNPSGHENKPISRQLAQEREILRTLANLGYEAKALPKHLPGKPGARAEARTALEKNPMFVGSTVFDKAWQRLRNQSEIQEKN